MHDHTTVRVEERRSRTRGALRWIALLLLCMAALVAEADAATRTFAHPGLLHSAQDLARIREKLTLSAAPWQAGWERLIANPHASLDWKPRPVEIVYRGYDGQHPENYTLLYRDAAAAYALALRWKLGGDSRYADKAVEIMNAWSDKLTAIRGTSDAALAAGIYGYEFANAGELMRDYKGWNGDDFNRFKRMMLDVFYPINHDFLVRHNNAQIDHYWANWDLAQLNAILAIGVLTDRADLYDEAIDYFKHGAGNGSLAKAIWKLYPAQGMGQVQESGRDQGHATLVIALLGSLCQMAWSQGDDLFGYDDNRVLKGAEYVAAYNVCDTDGDRCDDTLALPYTPYSNSDVTQTTLSPNGRGALRPEWELLYNHYVVLKGLKAPYLTRFAAKVRAEGGGGDYGPNSGGYDQLGYGTLLYSLQPTP
ncbi:alginate lyase family protein [Xanthomonas bonasiae]|uniref:alginate lyase family protein n=1 Tax=Xanthomonas bonasiae TaxID=2810351 RepID=UPI0017866563|nr:alginate lyase family protein [Xanthomonas surreyensis]MBD7923209.1 alginate lyase family protein [Xanthomonas surreyensis]